MPSISGAAIYDAATGLGIYQELVAATRKYHVAAAQTEANLGMKWEDQLPRLEEEFSKVQSRDSLVRALNHFANNLHNPHTYYHAPEGQRPLTPGFEIAVEWPDNSPRFYVAEVTDAKLADRLEAGDILVKYQDVDSARFLQTFALESNGNHWHTVAGQIAEYFSRQSPEKHGTQAGAAAEWVFQKRRSGEVIRLISQFAPPHSERPTGFAIEYQPDACAGQSQRDYGSGYALQQLGANHCVYTSGTGPAKGYPVVRQFSFAYSGRDGLRALQADHQNLKAFLGALKGVKGVILDLRDNLGGSNPNWFLDWWAPSHYADILVFTRLVEDLDSVDKLRQAGITGWGPPEFEIYLEALARKVRGQKFMGPRPFFCPTPDCRGWDNRYQPKNQVTRVPVALLVGPRCVSACDHLVFIFKENGFGPIIGTAASAGRSAYRLQYHVKHPKTGEDLGFIAFAFSYEISGKTGQTLEGVPIQPDHVIQPTFENQSRYDRLLVEAAAQALVSFPFAQTSAH